MRPSDTWKTVADLVDGDFPTDAVWRTLPLDAIENLATNTRYPPVRCVANRDKYAAGQYNIAIELVFDDGVVWIARLFTHHAKWNALSESEISRKLRCEVATLKLVKARTTIPVPVVFAFSDTANNVLGWPYVLMSALPGRPAKDLGIDWKIDGGCAITPDKTALFETYCASLAAIQLQLSKISFDHIGSVYQDPDDEEAFVIGPDVETGIVPHASETEWYAAYCDQLITDALATEKEEDQDDALFGLWLHSLLISTLSRSRDASRRYRLCHRDLHDRNTLVDETGRITGVLDWDCAGCMPIEIFATDACCFLKDPLHNHPDHVTWSEAYNRALRNAEDVRDSGTSHPDHTLSDLHGDTGAQLVQYIMDYLTPGYWCSRWFWEMICRHMFGTKEWAPFRESHIFLEWCNTQRVRAAFLRSG